MSPEILETLTALLGEGRVSDNAADLETHSRDWSPRALLARRAGEPPPPTPVAVVRPSDTAEVARLLAWAHETRTPVVPFGGGSSVAGNRRPGARGRRHRGSRSGVRGGHEEPSCTRGAGVTGPELRAALANGGYMLGHEPQSHDLSTVGGWVATCAVGQLSSGYGGIEKLVAGLTAVLPGGRTTTSKTAPRRSTGPDVAALMVGSEGSLGIITAVTLRVTPIPTGPLLLMSFDGEDAAARAEAAVSLTRGERLGDSIVEYRWSHRNAAVDEYAKAMSDAGLLGPHAMIDTIEVAATWTSLRSLYHSLKDRLTVKAALDPHGIMNPGALGLNAP